MCAKGCCIVVPSYAFDYLRAPVYVLMHVEASRMWRIHQQNRLNKKNIFNATHFLENMRINWIKCACRTCGAKEEEAACTTYWKAWRGLSSWGSPKILFQRWRMAVPKALAWLCWRSEKICSNECLSEKMLHSNEGCTWIFAGADGRIRVEACWAIKNVAYIHTEQIEQEEHFQCDSLFGKYAN